MVYVLIRWLALAGALLLLAQLLPGVAVRDLWAALWVALVLGFLNALVRPVLVLLTLPVTLLTLGLFLFVINALLFWAVSGLASGFAVAGFGWALLGSLLYSVAGVVIDTVLERLRQR